MTNVQRHPNIELLWAPDCPNADTARRRLEAACHRMGLPVRWTERNLADPQTPASCRGYGSPTVLVDGRDVAARTPADSGECCRIYRADDGTFQGAPSVETIAAALRAATE